MGNEIRAQVSSASCHFGAVIVVLSLLRGTTRSFRRVSWTAILISAAYWISTLRVLDVIYTYIQPIPILCLLHWQVNYVVELYCVSFHKPKIVESTVGVYEKSNFLILYS